MEPSTLRLLCDKIYDKRRIGAHDVERIIQQGVVAGNTEILNKVIDELCIDFAFAKNQPHTKSGGMTGLAAACVAFGTTNVSPYLEKIVPPVLAAFSDPSTEVRYFACEAIYNISKVAKREILVYFNEIFDSLCKLVTDPDCDIQNGTSLVDRLIKDIISSESASNYEPPLDDDDEFEQEGTQVSDEGNDDSVDERSIISERPFSLERFIPLLQERMKVTNAYSRVFLVSWISFLNAIPDLELVHYLPAFLDGLFAFLSDPNDDVHKATTIVLDDFLAGVKRIAEVQKKEVEGSFLAASDIVSLSERSTNQPAPNDGRSHLVPSYASLVTTSDNDDTRSNDEWILASGIEIDYPKILAILVEFAGSPSEEIQLRALTWISSFFEFCPDDIIPFVPALFSSVLPALASTSKRVQNEAIHVNRELKCLIRPGPAPPAVQPPEEKEAATRIPSALAARANVSAGPKEKDKDKNDERKPQAVSTTKTHTQPATPNSAIASPASSTQSQPMPKKPTPESYPDDNQAKNAANFKTTTLSPAARETRTSSSKTETPPAPPVPEFDYGTAFRTLTHQFVQDNSSTKEAALDWLILLHRQAPRKLFDFDGLTFPALLKVLSDPSEAVVTRDLNLLSQICRNTEDSYFTAFMVKLLQLFSTDRRLLDNRGNLIIRRLCMNLSPERIYRTLADCLKKEEDIEFTSIMVQNLNNNLITAPELADLRKRLRNIDTREGQQFFVSLFTSWCGNAVATFSLCLLAQAYEQAYNLLQTFAEFEINLNILIQIDKLVQLLESPVFTYIRLQLLEPDKYPYLYKCLYAILMLLPQSSAFGALKNRLNSINLALLQPSIGTTRGMASVVSQPNAASSASGNYTQIGSSTFHDRGTGPRVGKMRDGESSVIPWAELLDQFRSTQERYRRSKGLGTTYLESNDPGAHEFVNNVTSVDASQGEPGSTSSSAAKDKGSDSGIGKPNSEARATGTRATGQNWRSRGGLASLRLGIGNRKKK